MAKQNENIQEIITKKVIEEADKLENAKSADAEKEALTELTGFSRDQIDKIAEDVQRKNEIDQHVRNTIVKSSIALGSAAAIITAIIYLFFF